MEREFNAPLFTRFSDSLGHVEHIQSSKPRFNYSRSSALRAGDAMRFEVEVDTYYRPEEYTIEWVVCNILRGEKGRGH